MKTEHRRRAWLAAALVSTVGVGVGAAPISPVSAAPVRAALGACWLNKINVGLGDDLSARYYVTRWYAGSAQTIIQGQAPHARYWSMTLYHQQRGKILPLYDHQIVGNAGGAFKLVIGGPRPSGKAAYVDPTTGGGDSQGYLFFRLYKVSGALPPLPTVTIKGGPSGTTTCSGLEANLTAALTAADKKTPANGRTIGSGGAVKNLWPGTTPFRAWSLAIDPSAFVKPSNVQSVPLVTQLADPSIVYRVFTFNIANGDVVLHGKLPLISPLAPSKGMRYWSICAYPNNASLQPFSCIDDTNVKKSSNGEYVIVISPDNQSGNWINPGNLTTGSVVMRWVLPSGGVKARFCVPSLLTDRQPGDTTVPSLPSGC